MSNNIEWNVNLDCFKDKEVGEFVRSPKFCTSGSMLNNWHLQLYPKGRTEKHQGYLSLYLHYSGEDEIVVTLGFSLLNRDNSKSFEICKAVGDRAFKADSWWGVPKFVEERYVLDPKSGVVKDNKLCILCHLKWDECIVETESSDDGSERRNVFSNLENLLTDRELSDVTVTVGDQKFYLHKCILAVNSEVFATMFRSADETKSMIEIKDIGYEVMKELFNFIYTGKVDEILDIVRELLTAAEVYRIKELKKYCEDVMCYNLNLNNVVQYFYSANKNKAETIRMETISFMATHLKDMIKRIDFLELGMNYPSLLLDIMTIFFDLNDEIKEN